MQLKKKKRNPIQKKKSLEFFYNDKVSCCKVTDKYLEIYTYTHTHTGN